jgi:hypothetical protein
MDEAQALAGQDAREAPQVLGRLHEPSSSAVSALNAWFTDTLRVCVMNAFAAPTTRPRPWWRITTWSSGWTSSTRGGLLKDNAEV